MHLPGAILLSKWLLFSEPAVHRTRGMMTLQELRVGMPLHPKRWFATSHSVRVECVAWDWAVVRDIRGETYLVHQIDGPFALVESEAAKQTCVAPEK